MNKIHYTIGDLVINFESLCGIDFSKSLPGAELTLTWDEKIVTCKRCLKIIKSL
jgi:hypothetical protein